MEENSDNYDYFGHDASRGDNVSGYTMAQIEQTLIGCNTWIKWRDNIKNTYKYSHATYNIDALFASW